MKKTTLVPAVLLHQPETPPPYEESPVRNLWEEDLRAITGGALDRPRRTRCWFNGHWHDCDTL